MYCTAHLMLLLSTASALICPAPSVIGKIHLRRSMHLLSTLEDSSFIRTEPTEMFWTTPEGLSIEVLAKESNVVAKKQSISEAVYGTAVKFLKRITNNVDNDITPQKPPIIFIHGSFHAAWCYAENYLDYFSSLGHHSYAISLRGTSTTGMPPQNPGEVVTIEQHVSDVKNVLLLLKAAMADRAGGMETPDPIIVSHSFGGLIVMKLLEDKQFRQNISGACFLCSVPPSGNGPMIQRFIKTKFLSSLKIVWGFVFKAVSIDLPNCRELFFDKSVPSRDIEKYMTKFRADSRVALDLQALSAVLPSMTSTGPDGRADWLTSPRLLKSPSTTIAARRDSSDDDSEGGVRIDMDSSTLGFEPDPVVVVSEAPSTPSILVIGAEKDFIVDQEGVRETAQYLGVKPIFIPGAYHDVMLGPKWKLSADIVAEWLANI